MKTLISLAVANFVLGFVFSADLVAGEKETEKMLVEQGRVRLTAKELRAGTDFTGIGQYNTFYVDPTGTSLVYRDLSGSIFRKKRKITKAGKVCTKELTAPWVCFSVWKRGKVHVAIAPDGTLTPKHEVKPGNTENL